MTAQYRQMFFHRYYSRKRRPSPMDELLNRPKAKPFGTAQGPTVMIAPPRLIAGIAKANGVVAENIEAFLKQFPDPDEPREWRYP